MKFLGIKIERIPRDQLVRWSSLEGIVKDLSKAISLLDDKVEDVRKQSQATQRKVYRDVDKDLGQDSFEKLIKSTSKPETTRTWHTGDTIPE